MQTDFSACMQQAGISQFSTCASAIHAHSFASEHPGALKLLCTGHSPGSSAGLMSLFPKIVGVPGKIGQQWAFNGKRITRAQEGYTGSERKATHRQNVKIVRWPQLWNVKLILRRLLCEGNPDRYRSARHFQRSVSSC